MDFVNGHLGKVVSVDHLPVIIIGAGRSGTNALRDVLTALPGVGTWQCDEINYIWRHGNARYPTDEFPPELAHPRSKAYIRRAFDRLGRGRNLSHVVEKTCANSLRVKFVEAVIPEARFIHIVRDGRDVALSAAIRWSAALDLGYILKKARHVPPIDLPYYAGRYLWNRLYRSVASGRHLASWGPRFVGMQEALEAHPLPVACAIQWRQCVAHSWRDFEAIDPSRVFQLRYEDFVRRPMEYLRRLAAFLDIWATETEIHEAVKGVFTRSVGGWMNHPDAALVEQIHLACGDWLQRLGYDPAHAAPARHKCESAKLARSGTGVVLGDSRCPKSADCPTEAWQYQPADREDGEGDHRR